MNRRLCRSSRKKIGTIEHWGSQLSQDYHEKSIGEKMKSREKVKEQFTDKQYFNYPVL